MQNTPTSKSLQVFKDLFELRIITFWNILKDKNVFLLDKEYFEGKTYTKEEETELNLLFDTLYDEFFKQVNSQKSKKLIQNRMNEIAISIKINALISNSNLLVTLHNEYKEILDENTFSQYEQKVYSFIRQIEPKIKLQYFSGVEYNLNQIQSFIRALEVSNKANKDYNDKGIEHQIKNIYDVVASVESALGRSLTNIETMSVMQWLSYQKQYDEILKSKRNGKQ